MPTPEEMFDQAASGDLFNFAEHDGELVVFWPLEFEEDFETVNGTTDVIHADVLVVDGENAGEFYENSMLFGKVVVPSLKRSLNRMVLGRIGQGAKQPGKTPAWVIKPFTPEEAAEAVAAVEAHKAGQFATADEVAEAPAKAAPKTAAAKKAPAKPKVVIPDDKRALAESLLANSVPEETIAEAVGFSVEDLRAAEILPH